MAGNVKGIKCNKIEQERRVRCVQEWILLGHSASDIVRQLISAYDIGERMAYRYYKQAYELWHEEQRVSMENKKAYHLALRRTLLKNLKEKDTPQGTKAALEIANSIARIDGVMQRYGGFIPEDLSDGSNEQSFLKIDDNIEIEL